MSLPVRLYLIRVKSWKKVMISQKMALPQTNIAIHLTSKIFCRVVNSSLIGMLPFGLVEPDSLELSRVLLTMSIPDSS